MGLHKLILKLRQIGKDLIPATVILNTKNMQEVWVTWVQEWEEWGP